MSAKYYRSVQAGAERRRRSRMMKKTSSRTPIQYTHTHTTAHKLNKPNSFLATTSGKIIKIFNLIHAHANTPTQLYAHTSIHTKINTAATTIWRRVSSFLMNWLKSSNKFPRQCCQVVWLVMFPSGRERERGRALAVGLHRHMANSVAKLDYIVASNRWISLK